MKKLKMFVAILTAAMFLFNSSFSYASYRYISGGVIINDTSFSGESGGVFYIYSGGKLSFSNSVNFSNNSNSGGGIIYNNGITTISSGTGFYYNTGTTFAGAIRTESGTVTIERDVKFEHNSSTDLGGAIYQKNSTVIIGENTQFNENTASSQGGAIYSNEGSNLTIENGVIFYKNKTNGSGDWFTGGAISFAGNTFTIKDNVQFNENESKTHGGAIYYNGKNNVTIGNNSSFTSNKASQQGGAIYNNNKQITIGTDATFTSNTANNMGGAIYNKGNLTINNGAIFKSNVASQQGGAIYNEGILNLIANTSNIEFTGNTANGVSNAIHNIGTLNLYAGTAQIIFNDAITGSGTININQQNGQSYPTTGNVLFNTNITDIDVKIYGGTLTLAENVVVQQTKGIYLKNGGSLIANNNVSFKSNEAVNGGAILNDGGTATIKENSIFESNEASYGGAIYNNRGTIEIYSDVQFKSNTATNVAGAITNCSGVINIASGVLFEANEASVAGGAIRNTGTLTIGNNAQFKSNKANSDNGGAIYSLYDDVTSSITIGDSALFDSNTAISGGAICAINSELNIGNNASFTNNKALGSSNDGGAIVLSNVTAKIGDNLLVQENTATNNAGAILSDKSSLEIGNDSKFISNTVTKSGAAIYNYEGNLTIGKNSLFDSNTANKGGAIRNDGNSQWAVATVGDNAIFRNNQSKVSGGAIDNIGYASITIGHNSIFENNKATEDGSLGGAIYNRDVASYVTICSKSIFEGNTASYGGAIANVGTLVILDGGLFKNNIAKTQGGAIYNAGTLNLIANTNKIEFTGNTANGISNAIHNDNAEINLYAGKARIIFNDAITGTGTININKENEESYPTTGEVILNADMSGYTGNVNMSNGTLKLGEDGKFFNASNFTMSSGTLDISNGNIDTISLADTLSLNGVLNFDANLSSNTSDNFTAQTITGTVNINAINLVGSGNTSGTITLFNDGKAPELNVGSLAVTYDGIKYIFTKGSIGQLNYEKVAESQTLKEAVNDTTPYRSYSFAGNETVTEDLGDLGGTQLTIFGNGKNLTSESVSGITVSQDQTLNIENINTISGFNSSDYGSFVHNKGILNVDNNIIFTQNTAANGGVIMTNGGFTTIGSGVQFKSNRASEYAGALYNGNRLVIGDNVQFYSNEATLPGGAITNNQYGAIVIGNNAEFNENKTLDIGGAIYNHGDGSYKGNITIGADAQFTKNISTNDGGAIYNYQGLITIGKNAEFTENKTEADSKKGGAIYNNGEMEIGEGASFIDNYATEGGGAIRNDGELVIGENATFSNNEAGKDSKGEGGAIQNKSNGSVVINGYAKFESNSAVSKGGAIANINNKELTELTILNGATFKNNQVGELGGAIYNEGVLNLIANTNNIEFTGNTANGVSNAIHNTGTLNLYAGAAQIIFNDAITGSGAININKENEKSYPTTGTVVLNADVIGLDQINVYAGTLDLKENINIKEGKGIYLNNNASLIVNNGVKFEENSNENTSAIIIDHGNAIIGSDVQFKSNVVTGTNAYGGAILNYKAMLSIDDNVKFISNTANKGGGAIYNNGNLFINKGSEFKLNKSEVGGGAINSAYLNEETEQFSQITIENGALFDQNESLDGGAILANGTDLIIKDNVKFNKNIAKGEGGAILNSGNLVLCENITFEENEATKEGGAIVNRGSTIIGNNTKFISNTTQSSAGAIYNATEREMTIGDNVEFKSNTATKSGAGIYNYESTLTIGNKAVFDGNIANKGGAIRNDGNSNLATVIVGDEAKFINNQANYSGAAVDNVNNGTVIIGKNALFENNKAIADESYGGAIYNRDTISVLTILDGAKFTNNQSQTNGGAIYNQGTLNLIANKNNVEFTGNTANGVSNAIHSTGILNLYAGEAQIIFNDAITGTGAININKENSQSYPTTGKVVLNADMSGYTGNVNVSNGTLKLGENGSFFNANNFTMSQGTLDISNGKIDTISVVDTLSLNGLLKFDADLSNDTSDNFTAETVSEGTLNINAMNLIGSGNTSGTITLFNDGKSPTLNVQTTANYGGIKYTFTNGSTGQLNYTKAGTQTLKGAVNDTDSYRSYSFADNETVTEALGSLGGTQLTMFGNGKNLTSNNVSGITVSQGKTLNVENINTISGFNNSGYGSFAYNQGTLNIGENIILTQNTANYGTIVNDGGTSIVGTNVHFISNTANVDGGAIYNNRGTVEIYSNVQFKSNTATNLAGAIANCSGVVNIGSDVLFESNEASAAGGAIRNTGTLTIGNNAQFKSNKAISNNGGAIYAVHDDVESYIKIKDNVLFDLNTAISGGAIYAVNSKLDIGNNVTFTNNKALGSSNDGGAIVLSNGEAKIGDNLLVESNTATNNAGAILNDKSILEIGSNSTFRSNETTKSGAAIYNYEGTLTIGENSLFESNSANKGGAMRNDGNSRLSSITIQNNAKFIGNEATTSGGAIDNIANGTITIGENVLFEGNKATGTDSFGGAIHNRNENSQITIGSNSTFDSNSATTNGGAIYNKGTININSDSNFKSNTATQGGAIFNEMTINISGNAKFSSNKSTTNGGAIFNTWNINIADNAYFYSNETTSVGGAIYNAGIATIVIGDNAVFEKNNSQYTAGAIYNANNVTIGQGAQFKSNTAASQGGAIYSNDGSNITIGENAIFDSNIANEIDGWSLGGAISFVGESLTIEDNVMFNKNESKLYGGAIYTGEDSETTIGIKSTFKGNSAVQGGAIHSSGTLNIDENAIFTENSANITGGVMHINTGYVTIGENAKFISNTAGKEAGEDERAGGGAILNGGIFELLDNALFDSNTAMVGGAIRNNDYGNMTIGNNVKFKNNSSVKDGGAIFNNTSNTIGLEGVMSIEDNVLFENNKSTEGNGGAIANGGVLTLLNGGTFNNNTAAQQGGAIYNYCVLNLVADTNNIEFTGNTANGQSNAIHNIGILNLYAGEAQIIFNDAITGTGAININNHDQEYPTTGKIIVNADMSNYEGVVNVYDGQLKLETEGALFKDISLYSGATLNVLNGQIDNIQLDTLNTDKGILQLDMNLIDNISDNFTLINEIDPTKILKIDMINILGANEDEGSVTVFTGENSPLLQTLTVANYGGKKYKFFNSEIAGVLDYKFVEYESLKECVNYEYPTSRSYSFIADEYVTETIGNLGGNKLTIFGNGYNLVADDSDKYSGINVSTKQELNMDNIDTISGFSSSSNGSVLNNTGTINVTGKDITTFEDNEAKQGGAVYNTGTLNSTTNLSFESNKANNGGAIYNFNAIIHAKSNVQFESNKADANGGAIYNLTGNITFEDGAKFVNNSSQTQGGAIYSIGGTLNLMADNNDIEFSNNTARGKSNAIYSSGTTINLCANKNRNIMFSDSIEGTGIMNINGTKFSDFGNIVLDADMGSYTGEVNLSAGIVKITDNGTWFDNARMIKVETASIDMANEIVEQINFRSLKINGALNLKIDADLAVEKMDTINVNSYSGSGKINVNAINVLSDTEKEKVSLDFITGSSKEKVNVQTISTAYSDTKKYDVTYDSTTGNMIFSTNRGKKDKKNPISEEAAVASVISGYVEQMTVVNQAFTGLENQIIDIRKAQKAGTVLYASTNTNQVFGSMSSIEDGLWLRPYASIDKLDVLDGVDSTIYGTLAGVDLLASEDKLVSIYIGYNGAKQEYEDIKINQTGYTIGLTGVWVKDQWTLGATGNIGLNKSTAKNEFGEDQIDKTMYTIGVKGTYDIELDEKWTLQPSLLLMYSGATANNFTNVQGYKVEDKGLSNFTVEPQVRATVSLPKGWSPYGLIGAAINTGKTSTTVNNKKLDDISLDPYFEYGLGVNKEFEKAPWNCYAQVIGKSGARQGVEFNLGIKYKFGNSKKNPVIIKESVKPTEPIAVKAPTKTTKSATKVETAKTKNTTKTTESTKKVEAAKTKNTTKVTESTKKAETAKTKDSVKAKQPTKTNKDIKKKETIKIEDIEI